MSRAVDSRHPSVKGLHLMITVPPAGFSLPKLTPTQSKIILHLVSVFVVAFAGQLTASAADFVNISTLWAAITSAAAAALVTTFKAIGTIGQLQAALSNVGRVGVSLGVRSDLYQLGTGFLIMFVGALGANLATGAAHATSFPDLVAVIVAAISGAVFAAIQWIVGKIPAPKPAA
jgi:Ca2+/Na+ antiporter